MCNQRRNECFCQTGTKIRGNKSKLSQFLGDLRRLSHLGIINQLACHRIDVYFTCNLKIHPFYWRYSFIINNLSRRVQYLCYIKGNWKTNLIVILLIFFLLAINLKWHSYTLYSISVENRQGGIFFHISHPYQLDEYILISIFCSFFFKF